MNNLIKTGLDTAIRWKSIKEIPAKLGFQPDSMWDSNAKSWPL